MSRTGEETPTSTLESPIPSVVTRSSDDNPAPAPGDVLDSSSTSNDNKETEIRSTESQSTRPPLNIPKFLMLHHQDPNRKLCHENPFVIEKAIGGILGMNHGCKIKALRSGHLLIEADQKHQAELLLKTTNLNGIPVKVDGHRTLNTSKGVIYCEYLRDMTDDNILDNLLEQDVTEVYRLQKRQGNTHEPTDRFIMTFGKPTPPQEMKIGYMNVKVQKYIPNPRRCFNCQQYGHGKNTCRHDTVCAKCAQTGHEYNECQNEPKCFHCQKDHPTSSKDCPRWKIEKMIIELKTNENITFYEARNRVCKANQHLVQHIPSMKQFQVQTWSNVLATAPPIKSTSQTVIDPKTQEQHEQTQILNKILGYLEILLKSQLPKPTESQIPNEDNTNKLIEAMDTVESMQKGEKRTQRTDSSSEEESPLHKEPPAKKGVASNCRQEAKKPAKIPALGGHGVKERVKSSSSIPLRTTGSSSRIQPEKVKTYSKINAPNK